MRILLVEPPFYSFMHYDRWYYPSSLAQLAAVAHKANHEILIYDADKYFYKDSATRERSVFLLKQQLYYDNIDNYQHYIWQHFVKVLGEYKPDVVGVSVFTCKLKSAINTLKLVREYNPAIKTCVGGAHVSALPNSFSQEEYVDGVFVGYADITFPEWIARGCPRCVVQGITKNIDMASLPYPRRQALMFPERYTPKDLGYMIASRGCLGRCTFCSNSFMWNGKPVFRPLSSIRAELHEIVNDWQINDVLLGDAAFGDVPQAAKQVARLVKDFGLTWTTSISWVTMNKDILEYFVNCGCYKIYVGLESGSDKILKYIKKRCTKQLIREKADIINSLGLKWQLHAIVGFPTETMEDMQETLEFALEIKPTSISLNSFSPLPGTVIYNNMPNMTPEIASSVSQLHPNASFSKNMDIAAYARMFIKMTEIFDGYNKSQALKLK